MSVDSDSGEPVVSVADDTTNGDVQHVFISKKEYDRLVGRTTRMEWWAMGVVLVCFIAFVGFMVDAYRFHATTLDGFQRTLVELQSERAIKIETLLGDLSARIDSLE